MTANDSEYFITIEAPEKCKSGEEFKLCGRFKVPYEQNGVTVQGARVLKHVVLVVTGSGRYQAITPFKEVVVFEDDVTEDQDGCSGFFYVNVMEHIAFEGEGDYYLVCSLGAYLSNVIKTSI